MHDGTVDTSMLYVVCISRSDDHTGHNCSSVSSPPRCILYLSYRVSLDKFALDFTEYDLFTIVTLFTQAFANRQYYYYKLLAQHFERITYFMPKLLNFFCILPSDG